MQTQDTSTTTEESKIAKYDAGKKKLKLSSKDFKPAFMQLDGSKTTQLVKEESFTLAEIKKIEERTDSYLFMPHFESDKIANYQAIYWDDNGEDSMQMD
jgi:hypothetical protein